jgi:hypothetical protein
MLLTRDRQRGAIPLGVCEFWQDPLRGSALPVFHRPLAARVEWKLNMNWQNPDLYLFLSLLAGFAALLAIIYEFIQKSRKRKLPVVEPRRSTVTEKAVAPPSPPKHAAPPSPFDQLCESIKDLPPKEQARRMDQHFGAFGGARPPEGRGRNGKRPF